MQKLFSRNSPKGIKKFWEKIGKLFEKQIAKLTKFALANQLQVHLLNQSRLRLKGLELSLLTLISCTQINIEWLHFFNQSF